jgi:hypothetical protein
MYQFTGHVALFIKGRYWRKYEMRVKARSYPVASRMALRLAMTEIPARTRVEGIEIKLERLGKIVDLSTISVDETEGSPMAPGCPTNDDERADG